MKKTLIIGYDPEKEPHGYYAFFQDRKGNISLMIKQETQVGIFTEPEFRTTNYCTFPQLIESLALLSSESYKTGLDLKLEGTTSDETKSITALVNRLKKEVQRDLHQDIIRDH